MAKSAVTKLLEDSRELREQVKHEIKVLHNRINLVHASWASDSTVQRGGNVMQLP